MDWSKAIRSGIKFGVVALVGAVVSLLVGFLTYSLGYKPDGQFAQYLYTFVLVPAITGIIGLLQNWQKHYNDKVSVKK